MSVVDEKITIFAEENRAHIFLVRFLSIYFVEER